MSIKRLKHHAQNLGQMFCGWELMFDYKRLADLKSGALQIDILNKSCTHNSNTIQPLKIISGLHNWMVEDLKANKLSISDIDLAQLTVQFQTNRHLGQKSNDQTWADPTEYFVGCELSCNSIIKSKGNEYTSSYIDKEEWPESYTWIDDE